MNTEKRKLEVQRRMGELYSSFGYLIWYPSQYQRAVREWHKLDRILKNLNCCSVPQDNSL